VTARRTVGATLVVVALTGVAACGAVAPTPPVESAMATVRSASPAATTSRPAFGAELDIHTVPRELSGTTLEFVSDGSAIVYSSSRAQDSGPDGAPDLWRYEPGSAAPSLVWRNPEWNHSIVKIAGDLGAAAFVDMPLTGERAWNLWLVPHLGADAILLDRHPGDDDVPSLVPSIAIYGPLVAWTAFDRGPAGAVSQLLVAEAPDWQPRVVLERSAADAELWLPSLYGRRMVFTEVRYSADRSTDERHVLYLDLADPSIEPRRLDGSGRATMPLILDDTVLWKEADPGMNMFNWGRMFRFDLATGRVAPLSVAPQEQVNYPSIGARYAAWWGFDAFSFGVYDLERDRPATIERYAGGSEDNVLRPHVAGDVLVWLFADFSPNESRSELRYAALPPPGSDRSDD
jgi:hypothetical protein